MSETLTDLKWMKKLLAEEEVAHLALADDGKPYVIPINYAYIDDKIVLHCAMRGKKLDILRKNPHCCLAINRHPDKVKYHAEKKCHYRYQSVIVYGKASFVESAAERLTWIKRFRKYFNDRLAWTMTGEDNIQSAMKCGIILIEIGQLTARREEAPDEHIEQVVDK